jgi:hypothetical protein
LRASRPDKIVGVGRPFVDVRRHHPNVGTGDPVGGRTEYKGISTANKARVNLTVPIARIQRRLNISKTMDTGAQSMNYGEAAANNNTAWLVNWQVA